MLEDPFSKKKLIILISMNSVQSQLFLSRDFFFSFSFLLILGFIDWSSETGWIEVGEIISSF